MNSSRLISRRGGGGGWGLPRGLSMFAARQMARGEGEGRILACEVSRRRDVETSPRRTQADGTGGAQVSVLEVCFPFPMGNEKPRT